MANWQQIVILVFLALQWAFSVHNGVQNQRPFERAEWLPFAMLIESLATGFIIFALSSGGFFRVWGL